MHRLCPDCDNGKGLHLGPHDVACPEAHEGIICMLEVGDVVGDFLIEDVLPSGQGGYASMYLGRPLAHAWGYPYPNAVALKVASCGKRLALEREAAALSAMRLSGARHAPQIYQLAPSYQVPAFDGAPGITNQYVGRAVVDFEPFYYLALEYLPGSSVRDELNRKQGKGLGVGPALQVARQLADALDHMHAYGLMHLDVKPSHIMFNAKGEAVLIDFGISAWAWETGPEDSGQGTAPYAPREQFNQSYLDHPDHPDHRADIHALGVTIFEMLTGRLPYEGKSATDLASAVRVSQPLTLAKVSPDLDYLDIDLSRALAHDPSKRYNTAGKLVDMLEAAREIHDRHGPGDHTLRYMSVAGVSALITSLVIGLGASLVAWFPQESAIAPENERLASLTFISTRTARADLTYAVQLLHLPEDIAHRGMVAQPVPSPLPAMLMPSAPNAWPRTSPIQAERLCPSSLT